MKWSKQAPTEPGWYWYKATEPIMDELGDPHIVRVYRKLRRRGEIYLAFRPADGWCVREVGEQDFEGAWSGPIPPPDEP